MENASKLYAWYWIYCAAICSPTRLSLIMIIASENLKKISSPPQTLKFSKEDQRMNAGQWLLYVSPTTANGLEVKKARRAKTSTLKARAWSSALTWKKTISDLLWVAEMLDGLTIAPIWGIPTSSPACRCFWVSMSSREGWGLVFGWEQYQPMQLQSYDFTVRIYRYLYLYLYMYMSMYMAMYIWLHVNTCCVLSYITTLYSETVTSMLMCFKKLRDIFRYWGNDTSTFKCCLFLPDTLRKCIEFIILHTLKKLTI